MLGRGGGRRLGGRSCWGLALLPHHCAPRHLDLGIVFVELVDAFFFVVMVLANDF